ncbi:MAG TPA: signal recognition particle protein [Kiritimatiellia bacterium]|nr:signal recognition particle protein [Kiritimatiellia bacterium]HMP00116.1 signal recognition particle protein [Kiritimatiellia bacterium]HMP96577.1 signal recognition particle protein [Kiritimatiellia bacterium]
MFDKLGQSLQKTFKQLRGYGKLSDKNIQDALRDIRMALLEADVHFQVVKDFIAKVREKAMGADVLESITPGQQFTKHVHDEMIALLGGQGVDFDLSGRPATILMLGLHGSGKTTTTGKLAAKFHKQGRRVLVVAGDIRRPAAVDQLRILAGQVGVDCIAPLPGETVPALGARALKEAETRMADLVIFDTGGRFQIDTELVEELKDLRAAVKPRNVLLVLDAAIGQESVQVAETFHREVGLTGLVLTKLDGDARGGAALSVRAVTGCPVLLVGTGEKLTDLESFYPDRMASRILGMGDVITLVEKAQQAMEDGDFESMQAQLTKESFTLEDFLLQLRQIKKLGPLENLLEMLPGVGNLPDRVKQGLTGGQGANEMKRTEAIILSMTPRERRNPGIINASRRKRIARGCGLEVRHVNELLKRFEGARKMAKQMKKHQKRLLRLGR